MSCRLDYEEIGGRIDRIYFSTAVDDSDPMRKPNPGMALKAAEEFPDVKLDRSLMIGDQPSDRFLYVEFCYSAAFLTDLVIFDQEYFFFSFRIPSVNSS
jgi:histidinol phosphatase-like enzyme